MKQEKKQKSMPNESNKFVAITPRYLKFAEKSLKILDQKTNHQMQKKEFKLEVIKHNQLKRLEYLLKINGDKSKKNQIEFQYQHQLSLAKLLQKQQNQQKKQGNKRSFLQYQKHIWQQSKVSPNIINMQLIFTTYKTNYRKLQNLKKKFELQEKYKSLPYKQDLELLKPVIEQIENHTIDPNKTISKLTKYDIKELDIGKTQKFRDPKQQKNKTGIRFQLTPQLIPYRKIPYQLEQYFQHEYLNIQKLKPNKKQSVPRKKSNKKQSIIKSEININQKSPVNNIIKQNKVKKVQQKIQYEQKPHHFRSKSQQKKEAEAIKQFTMTKSNFNRKDHFVFGLNQRPIAQNKILLYRDFLWKINMSNGIFIEPQIELEKTYKVYIGKGNNSMLIKGLIKRRFWWTIVDKVTEQTNFIWTQLKDNDFLKSQKNYIKQQHSKTQSSTTVFTTAQTNSSQTQNKKQFKLPKPKQPIKVKDFHQNIFSQADMNLWNHYIQKNRKLDDQLSSNTYAKRAILLKNKNAVKIQNHQCTKIHNHFNSNFFIGNKKALFYSMRKYYQLNNLNVFDYLPLTFHISRGLQDIQYQKFLKIHNEFKFDPKIRNIWIVKPGEFTNRGTGITVCATLDDIKLRLKGREKNMNGKMRTFIVQKYLQRPFLYHRRKFDIRHYIMMTCINGHFKGYWYEDGYIRTTSYEYNTKNCKDNSIHLTNDAIQKNTQQYGKYEKGNKISYQEFQKYLDYYYKGQNLDFFEAILPKMKKISAQAMRASYFLLDPQRKTHNFQIFGMDFMIDQEFNPWLIQINTNPCLQLSSPLLAKIIPAMVQNAFKIGLDPLFQPPYNFSKKYQLGDNPLQTNKFSIIFDEFVQGEQIQQLYKNVQKVDKNMGDIEQQDEEYQDQGKQWNQQI